jgi:hypothetical protein
MGGGGKFKSPDEDGNIVGRMVFLEFFDYSFNRHIGVGRCS